MELVTSRLDPMWEPAHSTKEAFIADTYLIALLGIESLHEAYNFELVLLFDVMRKWTLYLLSGRCLQINWYWGFLKNGLQEGPLYHMLERYLRLKEAKVSVTL